MAIREAINQHPVLSGVVLFALVGVSFWFAMGQIHATPGTKEFYTDDDGKTYFTDASGKIVPYQRDGKEVVVAEVFESKTKPPFVAYMRQYTPATLSAVEKPPLSAQPGTVFLGGLRGVPPRMEYKKPGDPKWHDIEGNLKAMAEYLNLNSVDGSDLSEVDP
jgi:hypothetical protein